MKVIVLSPSVQSAVTNRFISKLDEAKGFEIKAIIYRKVFGIKRLKEQMNLGIINVAHKIINKFFIPKIISLFKKDRSLKNAGHSVYYVSNFNESRSVNLIKSFDVDIIVFTGGGILKKNVLCASKLGVLNCHLGILPLYRGMFPHIWAIYKNDYEAIGCTTHLMDEGIDTGPILSKFNINSTDYDFDELAQVLERMIPDCLMSSLQLLSDGKITYEHQKRQDGLLFKVPGQDVITQARENFQKNKLTLGINIENHN